MSWLSRLFTPLARLFGRRPAPPRAGPMDLGGVPAPPEPPPPPPPPPEVPSTLEVPSFPLLPEDAASVEVDEGEDAFEEEERAEDAESEIDAEAELDRRPDLDVIVAERQSRLDDDRREAEQRALEGEQRVRLTDPAGPGTLAETLARLEQAGRLTSRLDSDDGEPVLVYTPLATASAAPELGGEGRAEGDGPEHQGDGGDRGEEQGRG